MSITKIKAIVTASVTLLILGVAFQNATPQDPDNPLARIKFDSDSYMRGPKCDYTKVTPDMIETIRKNEGQHGMVVKIPACDIVQEKRVIPAAIQYETQFRAEESRDFSYNGTNLSISVLPQVVKKSLKDRFEFALVPKDGYVDDPEFGTFKEENTLRLNQKTRYVGFAIRFDKNYQVPDLKSYVIHLQAHQCCGGDDGGPPISLKVERSDDPASPIRLQLVIRTEANKIAKQNEEEGDGGEELLGSLIADSEPLDRTGIEVAREKWHYIVLRLEPRTPPATGTGTPGKVEMWLNGKRVLSTKKYWGYNAVKENGNKFSVKLGIYRRRHDRSQIFRLDHIKYGNTYNSVAAPD